MNLLRPSRGEPDPNGVLVSVTPESAGWRYVGFEALRLAAGERMARRTEGVEICLVVLSGHCHISGAGREWTEVGGRAGVFDGPPHAAYFPPGVACTVEAITSAVELAVCSAPARRGVDPMLLTPNDIPAVRRGSGSTERLIYNILMEERPAESLLVTEVVTPGGHWSSYPPHRHDTDDPPRETCLEETYYHRLRRPEGFAVQIVYTDDRSLDQALVVRDGDVVLVRRGYHPVSAAAGYDLYYLNVMAGPVRQWRVYNDPAHEWLLTC